MSNHVVVTGVNPSLNAAKAAGGVATNENQSSQIQDQQVKQPDYKTLKEEYSRKFNFKHSMQFQLRLNNTLVKHDRDRMKNHHPLNSVRNANLGSKVSVIDNDQRQSIFS